MTVSDTADSDTADSDMTVSDMTVSDTADSDTAVSDTAVSDTAVSDTAVSDTAVSDTAVSDTADSYAASESEEMYIITVARAIEDGVEPPVPVSKITEALEVSTVSANQMIRKLEAAGLVVYEPYKGVTLTATGRGLSDMVLRSRRLWGRFLSDRLGLTPQRADEVACEMEHVTPLVVAERLATYLGDPTTGPTGRPIPSGSGFLSVRAVALVEVAVGEKVVVESSGDVGASLLTSEGITEGVEITLLGKGSDGSLLLDGPSGPLHVSSSVASEILVQR